MDFFNTDLKSQDQAYGHLSVNALHVQYIEHFRLILTRDEKGMAFDKIHRGLQCLEQDQVPQGTPKPNKFVKKVMLCVWLNTQGLMHHKVLESGESNQ